MPAPKSAFTWPSLIRTACSLKFRPDILRPLRVVKPRSIKCALQPACLAFLLAPTITLAPVLLLVTLRVRILSYSLFVLYLLNCFLAIPALNLLKFRYWLLLCTNVSCLIWRSTGITLKANTSAIRLLSSLTIEFAIVASNVFKLLKSNTGLTLYFIIKTYKLSFLTQWNTRHCLSNSVIPSMV